MSRPPASRSGEQDNAGPVRLPERVGHFRPLRKLGEGGTGTVLLAEDLEIPGRQVALKMLAAHGPHRDLEALRREAAALAALQSDGIVTVHEIGGSGASGYLAMEYLPGGSLQDKLDREGPGPLSEGLRIAARVASTLHAAHQRQLLHCDVKPGNILLSEQGDPRLGDFGLALRSPESVHAAGDSRRITSPALPPRDTAVAGTPGYMAPEILQGAGPTPSSDQYAFGMSLHLILTGRHPFEGVPWTEAVQGEGAVLDESLPADLRGLIQRCISRDPEQRHGSMGEVHAALERAILKRDPARKRRRLAGWAAAGLLLVVTMGWAGMARARQSRALALNESGVAAFEAGDQESAFRDLSRAIALDPGLEPACANLGMLSLSEGNLERAVTILRDCAERFPASATILAGLGRAHWDRGDLETAKVRLRASLDLMSEGDPSPLVVNDLALILLEEGRAGEALDLLEEASLPPVGSLEGSVLRKTLGLARLQEGRTDRAVAALERALSGPLPPEPLGAALVGLGKAREVRGDTGGARKAYSRAILEAAGTSHADEARTALEKLSREDL